MANRLFLGVPLAAEARSALTRFLTREIPTGLPGREVPPENWHFTLRFLGPVDEEAAARLREAVRSVDPGQPFEIALSELGAFPQPRRSRVLWIGVAAGREPMIRLARNIESRVRRAGWARENRSFAPHLTLARLRDPRDLRELIARTPPAGIRQRVGEVVLFRSHPGGSAPRYETVERFSF